MKPTMIDARVKEALVDPASVFASPLDVVDENDLSTECRIKILRHWEYDAKEMQVADEEGFPARGPSALLDAVIDALHQLGAGPALEKSPPTKQGGV